MNSEGKKQTIGRENVGHIVVHNSFSKSNIDHDKMLSYEKDFFLSMVSSFPSAGRTAGSSFHPRRIEIKAQPPFFIASDAQIVLTMT